MHEQDHGLGDKPYLNYIVDSSKIDSICFVDCHEYWAHHSYFQIYTSFRMIKTLLGLHTVEMFALPPWHRPKIYESMPDRTVGLEAGE